MPISESSRIQKAIKAKVLPMFSFTHLSQFRKLCSRVINHLNAMVVVSWGSKSCTLKLRRIVQQQQPGKTSLTLDR